MVRLACKASGASGDSGRTSAACQTFAATAWALSRGHLCCQVPLVAKLPVLHSPHFCADGRDECCSACQQQPGLEKWNHDAARAVAGLGSDKCDEANDVSACTESLLGASQQASGHKQLNMRHVSSKGQTTMTKAHRAGSLSTCTAARIARHLWITRMQNSRRG